MAEGSKPRDTLWVVLAYAVAGAAAAGAVAALGGNAHPLVSVGAADVAATLVIFGFSVSFNNSSMYDAYWSVAPPALALVFLFEAGASGQPLRQALVIGLTFAWAARLTWNWFRGWPGLHHEDWRYVDLRKQTGKAYWLVSLTGIHLFPTALTYAAGLGQLPALRGEAAVGLLDAVAGAVMALGIGLEWAADNQLRRFRLSGPEPGEVLDSGLWAWTRNPNYLGEMLFWWGVWLFGAAAEPSAWWWTLLGPAAISLLFIGISIPMKEKRMAAKPAWGEYKARVPRLLPRPPRR